MSGEHQRRLLLLFLSQTLRCLRTVYLGQDMISPFSWQLSFTFTDAT